MGCNNWLLENMHIIRCERQEYVRRCYQFKKQNYLTAAMTVPAPAIKPSSVIKTLPALS